MNSDTPTQSGDRLDEIIAEYLAAEESGAAPPPGDIIAANPEMADELRNFFRNRDQFAGMAALPGEPPRKQFVPPTIRYFGDYELLDEIARGGMGVVYRAKQTSLNRIVALKMILSGQFASDEDVRRFRTEAEAAANLKHSGIVAVHEVGVHDGQHYFSMDYIEGRSLAATVRENPLPASKAAAYVESIAEAVHYAHQQGTLHRDLKPSNILIDREDHVHVTDFGLAARVEGDGELTRTGQILGTPAYMTPEQAQAKRGLIGPASDVYALGVILYESLIGRPPFRAESSVETLQQVIEAEPVSPRLLNPKVPRDLETICLKCLQKEPHKRYATARELADDLRRFLIDEPIHARPVGRIETTFRWCRRNPSTAGLLAVGLLLVTGLFAGVLWVVHERGERRERISRLEQGIEDAISNAQVLRQPFSSMLDRPEEWAAVLSSARSAQKQAESLIDQEPDEIDLALREQVDELRRQLDSDDRDLQFTIRYETIRMEMGEVDRAASRYTDFNAYPKTVDALASVGLRVGETPVSQAADQILNRSGPVQQLWISALDLCLRYAPTREPDAVEWIQAMLRNADPDPWRDEVRAAIAQGNQTQLRQLAEEVDVGAHPTSVLISLARALFQFELYGDTVSLLKRVHAVRPSDFWVHHWIGYSLLPGRLDQPEIAAGHFLAALAIRPKDAGTWVNLSHALYASGDVAGAFDACERAIAFAPDYAAAHSNLGAAYLARGDVDNAIDSFRTACRLQPDYVTAHKNLAVALQRRGDLDGAIASLQTAIRLQPDDPGALSILGLALREAGDLADAIPMLQRAVDLEPHNRDYVTPLIDACLEASQLPEAIAAVRMRLGIEPVTYNHYSLLAHLLRYTDDIDGYRAVCRTMFDKFARSDDLPSRHGLVSACLFFPDGEVTPELMKIAEANAERGLHIHKRMLGLAYYRIGDDEQALPLLKQATGGRYTSDSKITSLLCLSLVQLRLEQMDEARESIREARSVQLESSESAESKNRKPWGIIPSLWREVQAAMEEAGIDEPTPKLPPTYAEWTAQVEPQN